MTDEIISAATPSAGLTDPAVIELRDAHDEWQADDGWDNPSWDRFILAVRHIVYKAGLAFKEDD